MGRAERTLYRSVLRAIQQFERQRIPFTGPVGFCSTAWEFNAVTSVRETLRVQTSTGSSNIEGAVALLQRLHSQLSVLVRTDEETRQALAEWATLTRRWGQHGTIASSPAAPAAACEEGMDLISRHINAMMNPFDLSDDVNDSVADSLDAERPMELDDFAAAVRVEHPSLFPPMTTPHTAVCSHEQIENHTAKQLTALRDVLYDKYKFNYKPFEWVYEGFKPLLMSDVLHLRRGTPAALAIIATAIGRRLGLSMLPMPAAPIQAGAENESEAFDATSTLSLESLPPQLALRLSGRAQSVAPGPGPWLVRLDSCMHGVSRSKATVLAANYDSQAVFLDAGSGDILSHDDVLEKYPAVGTLSADDWRRQCALRTWQGLCRMVIQAHQRRGEADFVAHWVYVGLALDPEAPEWPRALGGSEVGNGNL